MVKYLLIRTICLNCVWIIKDTLIQPCTAKSLIEDAFLFNFWISDAQLIPFKSFQNSCCKNSVKSFFYQLRLKSLRYVSFVNFRKVLKALWSVNILEMSKNSSIYIVMWPKIPPKGIEEAKKTCKIVVVI